METNMSDTVYGSKLSKWIAGLYWGILVFIALLFLGIGIFSPMAILEASILIITFFVIFIIIAYTLYKAKRLRFIISTDGLILDGLLKKYEIAFSDIKDLKKVPIPIGFRLFGASFLGGRYYLPGIGNATVAMSNFDDGVLISTNKGYHFVITPLHPLDFIKDVKRRMK